MQNKVLTALNEGSAVDLLMLDLSAAFDTIDHQFLLSRLHDMYSIRFDIYACFKSYLSDRTKCININGVLLDTKKLTFGAPQGSILGSTLYCLYTKPVSDIICINSVNIINDREHDVLGNM